MLTLFPRSIDITSLLLLIIWSNQTNIPRWAFFDLLLHVIPNMYEGVPPHPPPSKRSFYSIEDHSHTCRLKPSLWYTHYAQRYSKMKGFQFYVWQAIAVYQEQISDVIFYMNFLGPPLLGLNLNQYDFVWDFSVWLYWVIFQPE